MYIACSSLFIVFGNLLNKRALPKRALACFFVHIFFTFQNLFICVEFFFLSTLYGPLTPTAVCPPCQVHCICAASMVHVPMEKLGDEPHTAVLDVPPEAANKKLRLLCLIWGAPPFRTITITGHGMMLDLPDYYVPVLGLNSCLTTVELIQVILIYNNFSSI
jgi:hypothetical protein